MNIEQLRNYCLSLPYVTEAMPFDDTVLTFKLGGKMFCLLPLNHPNGYAMMKCDPERAILLRERYFGIEPAYHMNKTHWNGIYLDRDVSDQLLKELIQHSYDLVLSGLSRRVRASLAESV